MISVVPLRPGNSLTLYDQAKRALAECYSIDECKLWSDQARAIREYAKQRDDDAMVKMAHKIRGRAIRRIGELLADVEPASQANLKQNRRAGDGPSVTRKQVAADAGLSERQAKEALRVANVPTTQFEHMLEAGQPIGVIAKEGTASKPTPLIDLRGIDPELYNLGIRLNGAVILFIKTVSEIPEPAHVAKHGMFPERQPAFRERLAEACHLLEALRDAL